MSMHTRRDFLFQTAAMGGALAMGSRPAFAEDAAARTVDMAIARWQNENKPEGEVDKMAGVLTRKAMEALGGMKRFVNKGDVVWIKPNMGWDKKPEYAANTNPQVVVSLIQMCFEAGAGKVKVGDRTCNEAKLCYASSGIEAAAKAAGAEVLHLDDSRYKETALNGAYLKSWPVYSEILDSNLVINAPVVKHHRLSTATLCMKNYMGIIGGERGKWHQDVASCLVDITAFMKPRLCLLDAMRILTNHGPQGGDLADVKRCDSIAAGVDIVALDAFGAELLGHKPADIATIAAGARAGLGQMDYRKLNLSEVNVA